MGGYFIGSLAVLILCAFLSLFSALTYYLIRRFSIKDKILFNSIKILTNKTSLFKIIEIF